ncbi:hypothetical protein EG328_005161 [Venturia inaequalis]|uniref:F-box domain-containing protein n=1 Tax=Venturia inaequalis TaxID=5025 RepID=A0A8H3YWA7_VENIN|nr:hypothetical protein EG328_005161 [Venturia inaequalis]
MSRFTVSQRASEVFRLDEDNMTPITPPSRPSLLQLPNELIEQIAGKFTLVDLSRFRLTTRRLFLATSRLFGHTHLREIHLSVENMDWERVRTMIHHSKHNVWEAGRLKRVVLRVWPFMGDCEGDCGVEHVGSVRRVVCPHSFLKCLKDLKEFFEVLPGSVETLAIVPWRPERRGMWSDWHPRCEYFFLLQTALRVSGVRIQNVEVYADERPVVGKEFMEHCLSYPLADLWARYWPEEQMRSFAPERLAGGEEVAGAGMSLTMYGWLDFKTPRRPAVPLRLQQLRMLTFTSGRMRHLDVAEVLRAHRHTLGRILFHNVILGQGGYKYLFNGMTQGDEEGEVEEMYPYLTHFEVANAWERDFDRVLYLRIPARRVVFGPGDGVENAVGKVMGDAVGMREGIERLKRSVRYLTAAQTSRGVSATG